MFDLTTFCRLDGLGRAVTAQLTEPDCVVLARRVTSPDDWGCGRRGTVRDIVIGKLAHLAVWVATHDPVCHGPLSPVYQVWVCMDSRHPACGPAASEAVEGRVPVSVGGDPLSAPRDRAGRR